MQAQEGSNSDELGSSCVDSIRDSRMLRIHRLTERWHFARYLRSDFAFCKKLRDLEVPNLKVRLETLSFYDVVESTLSRFREQITRVEVHLSDENAHKSAQDDKRCMMEARLEGQRPTAVTHQAANLDQAINGAADKLQRSIESTLGRLHDHR